ncbi:DEAD/DEAH box helicase family protein [bacterium]|nr:DEAD/DEAH box helicase family protein [bacterium]
MEKTNRENQLRELEKQLQKMDADRISLLREIHVLREELVRDAEATRPLLGRPIAKADLSTNLEKVRVFLDLFRAREDIFPRRWENQKTGKAGYAPACANEWAKPLCQKPKIRCTDCTNQKFLHLDQQAVESHLRGSATIGTYGIRADDSCVFLACDFDESSWQSDVATFRDTGRALGVDVAVERSRSGNGAHAWIFFEEPIPAKTARSLGTLILAKCSERNLRLSLESYDRFFPSQDYLPKGGFGNLIALPLQRGPREAANSVFLDAVMNPYEDQGQYLNQVRRLSLSEVRQLLREYTPTVTAQDGFEDIALLTDNSILEKTSHQSFIEPALSGKTVEVTFGPMLVIPLDKLPGRVVAKLKKTASFANPEFYKRQRMRMQTYPLSRFIFSGEMRTTEIVLPRGVLDEVTKILTVAGVQVIIRDERIGRKKLKADFTGELTQAQTDAVKRLRKSDIGILMAPPGSGKTVMACALMSERKVSTLVLVHRQPLLEQWRERISTFLGIPPKEIGNLSGTKKKITGKLDLVMLQSLTKVEDLSEIAQSYSQIIIDECHHIPAASFEDILRQIPARYVVGLTATPYRKDGLEKILFQQCGPIRVELDDSEARSLDKIVTIHETGFRLPSELGERPPYHELIHHLTSDVDRNQFVAQQAVSTLRDGRFPLLISDRKEHLDVLSLIITESANIENLEVVRLDGDLTLKQRRNALEQLHSSRADGKTVILMATASLIGEGFDLPALDTMILATPMSFEGRMIQYAGRIHRQVEGKTEARIVDFVDFSNAMLIKMYRNRIKAYRKMGYSVSEPEVSQMGPLARYGLHHSQ